MERNCSYTYWTRLWLLLILVTALSGCRYGPFETQSVIIPSSTALLPNDPLFAADQWYLDAIEAPAAWGLYAAVLENPISISSSGLPQPATVSVAVIDDGLDGTHPEFAGVLGIGGADLYQTRAISVPNGFSTDLATMDHGTHVAGLIAAVGDNGEGIAGVAYNGYGTVPVRIVPVRSLRNLSGSLADLIEGILYSAGELSAPAEATIPPRVVNMSLGASGLSAAEIALLESAVAAAVNRDILLVAAAGNDGSADGVDWPARIPTVVAVGSVDRALPPAESRRSSFSDYGPEIDLVAPGAESSGTGILSTVAGGGYARIGGTSMATPLVAGAAALLRSANPALSAADVRAILRDTALDLGSPGFDNETGWGLLQVEEALRRALESPFGYSRARSTQVGRDGIPASELQGAFTTTLNRRSTLSAGDEGAALPVILVYLERSADPREVLDDLGFSFRVAGNLPLGRLVYLELNTPKNGAPTVELVTQVLEDLATRPQVLLATPDRTVVGENSPLSFDH